MKQVWPYVYEILRYTHTVRHPSSFKFENIILVVSTMVDNLKWKLIGIKIIFF